MTATVEQGVTWLPIERVPEAYAGSLSVALAYAIGRRAAPFTDCPYPLWTKQAEAWLAGRGNLGRTA